MDWKRIGADRRSDKCANFSLHMIVPSLVHAMFQHWFHEVWKHTPCVLAFMHRTDTNEETPRHHAAVAANPSSQESSTASMHSAEP